MPHQYSDSWDFANGVLEPLIAYPGLITAKLSRKGYLYLLIENEHFYYNLNDYHDQIKLHNHHLNYTTLIAPLIDGFIILDNSFILAPSANTKTLKIFMLENHEDKNHYVFWHNSDEFINNFTSSRVCVKYAISQTDEEVLYKSKVSHKNHLAKPINFQAGIAITLPFQRSTFSEPFLYKIISLIHPLGIDLRLFFKNPNHQSIDLLINIFSQCISQLQALHDGSLLGQPYVHRDVKFRNFVIDHDNKVKLIDYDDAMPLLINKTYVYGSAAGTIQYCAPELFLPSPDRFIVHQQQRMIFDPVSQSWVKNSKITDCIRSSIASDIYALGASLREILPIFLSNCSVKTHFILTLLVELMTDSDPLKRFGLQPLQCFLYDLFPEKSLMPEEIQFKSLSDIMDWQALQRLFALINLSDFTQPYNKHLLKIVIDNYAVLKDTTQQMLDDKWGVACQRISLSNKKIIKFQQDLLITLAQQLTQLDYLVDAFNLSLALEFIHFITIHPQERKNIHSAMQFILDEPTHSTALTRLHNLLHLVQTDTVNSCWPSKQERNTWNLIRAFIADPSARALKPQPTFFSLNFTYTFFNRWAPIKINATDNHVTPDSILETPSVTIYPNRLANQLSL